MNLGTNHTRAGSNLGLILGHEEDEAGLCSKVVAVLFKPSDEYEGVNINSL
jgi:hypothetical protein